MRLQTLPYRHWEKGKSYEEYKVATFNSCSYVIRSHRGCHAEVGAVPVRASVCTQRTSDMQPSIKVSLGE